MCRDWSKISKDVGWNPRLVYPPTSLEEVSESSPYKLVEWNRFLTSEDFNDMNDDIHNELMKRVWSDRYETGK